MQAGLELGLFRRQSPRCLHWVGYTDQRGLRGSLKSKRDGFLRQLCPLGWEKGGRSGGGGLGESGPEDM